MSDHEPVVEAILYRLSWAVLTVAGSVCSLMMIIGVGYAIR